MLTEERFFIMSLQERDCWTLQTMLMYRVSTGSTHQAGIPCAGYTIRLHILPCLSSWGNTYSPEVHRQIFVRQDKSRISNLNCQISLSWLKDIINLCSSTYLANTHLRLQWLCQIHQSFIFLKPKLYPKWFYGVLGAQVLFSNISGQTRPVRAQTSLLSRFNNITRSYCSFPSLMVFYSTAQRTQLFDFYEINSYPGTGSQSFGFLPLGATVIWTLNLLLCSSISHQLALELSPSVVLLSEEAEKDYFYPSGWYWDTTTFALSSFFIEWTAAPKLCYETNVFVWANKSMKCTLYLIKSIEKGCFCLWKFWVWAEPPECSSNGERKMWYHTRTHSSGAEAQGCWSQLQGCALCWLPHQSLSNTSGGSSFHSSNLFSWIYLHFVPGNWARMATKGWIVLCIWLKERHHQFKELCKR